MITVPSKVQILVDALMRQREEAACWRPVQPAASSGTTVGRTETLPPEWLIDDGNLVIALVCPPVVQGSPPGDDQQRILANSLDKTGRWLDGVVVDAGLHRLLALVVVMAPEDPRVSGLAGHLETRGHFRVLIFQGTSKEECQAFAERLTPLEAQKPFLKKIDEAEDIPVAIGLVKEFVVEHALSLVRTAVADDVERQLLSGPSGLAPWSVSRKALADLHTALPQGNQTDV